MCQFRQQIRPSAGNECGTVGRFLVAKRHTFSVLAVLAGFLLVLGAPAPVPAQSPGVGQLRHRQASLAAESRAAIVQLYGLESRLAQARSDLARVQSRARALARTEASVRLRLKTARQTMVVAQRDLGDQLRYLYEQGTPDPIAVVLGATSLENAIDALDAVHRARRATQSVLDQARSARTELLVVRRKLAVQVARTNEARSRLAETAAELERAHAERTAYLSHLRQEQQLTATQIARLEQQAEEARARAQQVSREAATTATATPSSAGTASAPQPAPVSADTSGDSSVPPPAPVESIAGVTPTEPTAAPPPPRPGGTMTVYATGYCLTGTTATGLPVGPGIVATDPAVIPLGTRMTIPGYGEGVAADTGSGVQGRRIDVWIKSCAAAGAFGRTVTITFH
jgi:3D (Asp-Asp-Asp) domain-containing protein/peptidoglycan hydrolase CwlO-like protein